MWHRTRVVQVGCKGEKIEDCFSIYWALIHKRTHGQNRDFKTIHTLRGRRVPLPCVKKFWSKNIQTNFYCGIRITSIFCFSIVLSETNNECLRFWFLKWRTKKLSLPVRTCPDVNDWRGAGEVEVRLLFWNVVEDKLPVGLRSEKNPLSLSFAMNSKTAPTDKRQKTTFIKDLIFYIRFSHATPSRKNAMDMIW